MRTLTAPVGTIQVTAIADGFKVYGRMGAVMVADSRKAITYSNLNPEAQEYMRMEKALKAFKA